jgi:hypothetical protein
MSLGAMPPSGVEVRVAVGGAGPPVAVAVAVAVGVAVGPPPIVVAVSVGVGVGVAVGSPQAATIRLYVPVVIFVEDVKPITGRNTCPES